MFSLILLNFFFDIVRIMFYVLFFNIFYWIICILCSQKQSIFCVEFRIHILKRIFMFHNTFMNHKIPFYSISAFLYSLLESIFIFYLCIEIYIS